MATKRWSSVNADNVSAIFYAMRRNGIISVILLALLCCSSVALAGPSNPVVSDDAHVTSGSDGLEITWRVVNPFRFFEDPKDTERHRQVWLGLNREERQAPILAAERKLNSLDSDGWASKPYRRSCWSNETNSYKCTSGTGYLNPESHRVTARLDSKGTQPEGLCHWRFQPAPKRVDDKAKVDITRPCVEAIEFDVPFPDGGTLTVESESAVSLATAIKVTDLFVVGMGDSFASGEGNPDVPVRFSSDRVAAYGIDKPDSEFSLAGFPARSGPWRDIGDKAFLAEDARWLDKACHRSLYSHQLRVALQLAVEHPHRSVTFAGFSCSGAEITEGLFLRYKGHEWVKSPPDLSQISAAAVAQCGVTETQLKDYPEAYHMKKKVPELENILVLNKCPKDKARKIDLLLLSIGGNDIGFSRLVANVVLSDKSKLKQLGGWIGAFFQRKQAEAKLKKLSHRFKALRRVFHYVLHIPWPEADRVILTGYPGLAFLSDGKRVCPGGRAGMEILPAYQMSKKRVREGVMVAEQLNRDMKRYAKGFGWRFADMHRPLFNGRGVCAGNNDQVPGDVVNSLRLPRFNNGQWQPYNPSLYRAYEPRQRWFRTPNDAFMTGNFHVSQHRLPKALRVRALGILQLLLASTYSGAYHPTAEGQAAIGDAVLLQARKVLRKYGQ